MPKFTSGSPTKTVTSIRKITPTLTTIDVQYDHEAVVVTGSNEFALTVDEIGNLFQVTSTEEELGTESTQANM